MTTPIEAVITDWSGVLSDDLSRVHDTTNKTLVHYGAKEVSLHQFKEEFDIPFENFYRNMGVFNPMEEVQKTFGKLYESSKVKIRPFSRIRETLRFLKEQQDKALILASGHRPEYIKKEAESYGITKYFDRIKGGFPLKGDVMDDVIKEFGVDAKKVLFVEDMECGIRDAKQRKIKALAIAGDGSYRTYAKLMASKPDFIASDFYSLKLFWKDFFV